MKVVEYWHGTNKNYRYDGDVSHNGIFISQEKYLKDVLRKFDMQDCKGVKIPDLKSGIQLFHLMVRPSASTPSWLQLTHGERIREVGGFLHIPPWPYKRRDYLKIIDLRPIPHPAKNPQISLGGTTPTWLALPALPLVPTAPKKVIGRDVPYLMGQLMKLQKQGFLPPVDLVPVRAGLTSFNGGV